MPGVNPVAFVVNAPSVWVVPFTSWVTEAPPTVGAGLTAVGAYTMP